MPKGISLHIGVDVYDKKEYKANYGIKIDSLPNCCSDAKEYFDIATGFGFMSAILMDKLATRGEILHGIDLAAHELDYGDIFFLSFSGHGGQARDLSGDEKVNDKADEYDETWCAYNKMIRDDELFRRWQTFRPGVRVLIIADCCYSGASTKNAQKAFIHPGDDLPPSKTEEVRATCLLMAACQGDEEALGSRNTPNSVYTHLLLQVLKEYEFCDSYRELNNRISARMPAKSRPQLLKFGPGADQFARSRPFKI